MKAKWLLILIIIVNIGLASGLVYMKQRNVEFAQSAAQWRVEVAKKKADAAAESIIANQVNSLCERFDPTNQFSIQEGISTLDEWTMVPRKKLRESCPEVFDFITGYDKHTRWLMGAVSQDECYHNGYGAEWSAVLTNPLPWSVDVTIRPRIESGGLVVNEGIALEHRIQPGEARALHSHMSMNGWEITGCGIDSIEWTVSD